MEFYLAPLEGITGYIYRNAYHTYFGGMDKYFIPFISPNQFGHLGSKEKNNISPENNKGMRAIPQILTNSAEDFVETTKKLQQYGYTEVNLNLGCPSKTVVTKGRGSGFLAYPDKLDCFLGEIFGKSELHISIKTRIGKESPEEFENLLKIYNQYPMEELIIHPRLQSDMYRNTPNMKVFREAVKECRCNICYNGDIFTEDDFYKFTEAFPQVQKVMFGRGILSNPGLVNKLQTQKALDKNTLKSFHDNIYGDYQKILFGEKTILFKMKEIWFYMAPLFSAYEKYAKRIKKAEKLAAYEAAVNALFAEQNIGVSPLC